MILCKETESMIDWGDYPGELQPSKKGQHSNSGNAENP
eukprot:gene13374-2566_t